MTIDDAVNYFKLELDKTSSLELPSFETEEIYYWLDDAILKFIKQRYSGQNVKGESFEQSQKRIDDLRLLIREQELFNTALVDPIWDNAEYFAFDDLTDAYLYSVREVAKITVEDVGTFDTRVIPTSQDRLNMKLEDPFSEHLIHFNSAKPLRILYRDGIVLLGDGNYDINSLKLTYIKYPESVDDYTGTQYPDLTDSAMQEVIKMAANSALENIESQRYQTHSAEVAQME